MKEERFSAEITAMLQLVNGKEILDIFFHEKEGCILEVQTDLKSPYLFFEIEINEEKDNKIEGKIVDISLIQLDQEIEEIYCGDIALWHRGLTVSIVFSDPDKEGIMSKK